MIHDRARVEGLWPAAKSGIEVLDELRAKATDSSFHEMLDLPRSWFGDIEPFSLSQFESQDRTPAEEARWLDGVKYHLDMTNQLLRKLKEMFNTYSQHIKVIG